MGLHRSVIWRCLLVVMSLHAATAAGGDHYLVELAGESPAEVAAAGRGPVAGRRVQAQKLSVTVRASQERQRLALGISDRKILHRLNFLFNGFILDLSERQAQDLAARPGVRAVHPLSGQSRYVMDHALTLLGVPEAWTIAPPSGVQGAGIKIGVVDSILDVSHPAFQDAELPMPEGFPRGNDESDLAKTSNKVIVYRTFDAATATGPANALYHGTAVAMVAAGSVHESPLGLISGIAPKAWIGFYQVGDFGNDAVLRGIEAAAADGMDVINLSVAFIDFSRPAQRRPYELAAERAYALGSALVWGAGNIGPERATVQSHSYSDANLIAGGTLNSRVYAGSMVLEDGEQFLVRPLEGAAAAVSGTPVEGLLRDARDFDSVTQGCSALLPGAVRDLIILVDVSTPCLGGVSRPDSFRKAGASAVVAFRAGQDLKSLSVLEPVVDYPLVLIAEADARRVLAKITRGGAKVSLLAEESLHSVDSTLMAPLSSRGPTISDYQIRPDVSGVAQYVYVAVPGGFTTVDGTSLATPMVSGGIALMKAARPQLTPAQLYSLAVNAASPISATVMDTGAGRINVAAGMRSMLTALPRSISCGISSTIGRANADMSRELTITNIGDQAETVEFAAQALAEGQMTPNIHPPSLTIEPGQSGKVQVRFVGNGIAAGEYQGLIRVTGPLSGTMLRVPYWYGVPSGVPATIKVLNRAEYYAGGTYLYTPLIPTFRVLDLSGIPIVNMQPRVAVVSGGATVLFLNLHDSLPGVFQVGLKFSATPGNVVLRITAGSVVKDVVLSVVTPVNPRVEPDRLALDFGPVLSGFSKDLELNFGSAGGKPLTVTQTPLSDPQFRVVSPAVPFTVAPGVTQRIVVRFTPSAAGTASSTLNLYTNDPTTPWLPINLSGLGVAPSGPLTLRIDGDFSDGSIGYGNGTATAYFVNRLTPPKYPAVLQSVQIFFGTRSDGLKAGTPITVVARPNPSGTPSLESFSFLQQQAASGPQGSFSSYTFPASQTLRIESGDFVVGFLVNNPPGIFPADQDRSTPSQRRSYVSNGGPFTLVDIDAGIPGNFMIRAVVTFP